MTRMRRIRMRRIRMRRIRMRRIRMRIRAQTAHYNVEALLFSVSLLLIRICDADMQDVLSDETRRPYACSFAWVFQVGLAGPVFLGPPAPTHQQHAPHLVFLI
jgi:hypothetical protein